MTSEKRLRDDLAAWIHGRDCTCPYAVEETDLRLADEALARLHGSRATVDVRPDLNGERAALQAGTHTPAVDDFGNQYLERVRADSDWEEVYEPRSLPPTVKDHQVVVMPSDHFDDDCSGPCCA